VSDNATPPQRTQRWAEAGLAKAGILLLLGCTVVGPAVWLIYVLGLANGVLRKALTDRKEIVEGPIEVAEAEKAAKAKSGKQSADAGAGAAKPEQRTVTEEQAWATIASDIQKQFLAARAADSTDPPRSREILEQILRDQPKNERALRLLASKMMTDEQLPRARELVERCLAVNPTNYSCTKVGELVPKMTVDPKSRPILKRFDTVADACLKATPDNVECLASKLRLALALGNRREARAISERLARVAPKSPQLKVAQGRLAASTGVYASARVLFESACGEGETTACFRAEVLRLEGF
jgi:predicted Zn-dependent protease